MKINFLSSRTSKISKAEQSSEKSQLFGYISKNVSEADIVKENEDSINTIKYMKLALQIVSSYISTALASCEFKVFEKNIPVKDITYYRLNISPNPNETGTKLKHRFVKKIIDDGEALIILHKNYLYLADSFNCCKESMLGNEYDSVQINDETLQKKFNQRTSFYLQFGDENIKSILNEIDAQYSKIIDTAMKLYYKSLSNKWKIKIDSMKQNDPKFQEEFENYVKNQLEKFIKTNDNVYPELNGYSLEKFNEGNTQTDTSDIRNLRKDIFDMVALAYKMPPSMMYGNISNLKEVVNQFITFSIKPYATLIGEEFTRKLFSQDEILNGNSVQVDISTINYKDIFDVANGIEKLVSNAVANIDEVRPLINLPPLNTEYSKQYWLTKNYEKIEDAMNRQSSEENSNKNTNNSSLKGGGIDEK